MSSAAAAAASGRKEDKFATFDQVRTAYHDGENPATWSRPRCRSALKHIKENQRSSSSSEWSSFVAFIRFSYAVQSKTLIRKWSLSRLHAAWMDAVEARLEGACVDEIKARLDYKLQRQARRIGASLTPPHTPITSPFPTPFASPAGSPIKSTGGPKSSASASSASAAAAEAANLDSRIQLLIGDGVTPKTFDNFQQAALFYHQYHRVMNASQLRDLVAVYPELLRPHDGIEAKQAVAAVQLQAENQARTPAPLHGQSPSSSSTDPRSSSQGPAHGSSGTISRAVVGPSTGGGSVSGAVLAAAAFVGIALLAWNMSSSRPRPSYDEPVRSDDEDEQEQNEVDEEEDAAAAAAPAQAPAAEDAVPVAGQGGAVVAAPAVAPPPPQLIQVPLALSSNADRMAALADRIRSSSVSVVTGTGVSIAIAGPGPSRSVMSWPGLISALARSVQVFCGQDEQWWTTFSSLVPAARRTKPTASELMQQAQFISTTCANHGVQTTDYTRFVFPLYTGIRPSAAALSNSHKSVAEAIRALNCPIGTTNYDMLLEEALHRFEVNLLPMFALHAQLVAASNAVETLQGELDRMAQTLAEAQALGLDAAAVQADCDRIKTAVKKAEDDRVDVQDELNAVADPIPVEDNHQSAIYHLHGVWFDRSGFVLSQSEYEAHNSQHLFAMRHLAGSQPNSNQCRSFFFIGCGTEGLLDSHHRQLLIDLAKRCPGVKHYCLMRRPEVADLEAALARVSLADNGVDGPFLNQNVEVIEYGTEYDHLTPFLWKLATASGFAKTEIVQARCEWSEEPGPAPFHSASRNVIAVNVGADAVTTTSTAFSGSAMHSQLQAEMQLNPEDWIHHSNSIWQRVTVTMGNQTTIAKSVRPL